MVLNLKVVGIVGAVVIAGILVAIFAISVQSPSRTGLAGQSFSAGAFTVTIVEDNPRRIVADFFNNGPTLENAAAFIVKRGFNENCEPMAIMMANFEVITIEGGVIVEPDVLIGGSTVTVDSRDSDLSAVPFGPDIETTAYVLGLEPDVVQASHVIQEIPIYRPDASMAEIFERCLEQAGRGYPLLLHILNPQAGAETYVSIVDIAGNRYETSLAFPEELPDDFVEIFWPDHPINWLTDDFATRGGPVPAFREAPALRVTVSSIVSEEAYEFSHNLLLLPEDLVEYSMDFEDTLLGRFTPIYPKYWQVQINMFDGTIS